MLFQTLEFFVFFVVVATFAQIYRGPTRKWLLLLASYYFYMAWDPRFSALILASTLIDYVCGLRIQASENPRPRKRWLVLSLASNLGLLAAFKYFGFFSSLANDFLEFFQIQSQIEMWQITLPVGISFFTFQSMSHTIDVYRREITAERSFLNFATYVAFFPQLVAGPIVRARDFLPQIREGGDPFDAERLLSGLQRILIGLVKKVVVADTLGTLVDAVFAAPDAVDTPMAWLGAACFGLQIYLDFSGYSDMAIGLARILGYRIPENFDLPYLSASPSEFWNRWHVSLSSWLRDYLYVPLGGNRMGRSRTLANLLLTMLLGGLWHGPHYRFLLWGLGHGLLLILYRLARPVKHRLEGLPGKRALAILIWFVLVTAMWVPFRAGTAPATFALWDKMFLSWQVDFEATNLSNVNLHFIAALLGAVLIVHLGAAVARARLILLSQTLPMRAILWGGLAFAFLQLRHDGLVPFVYFQF